MANWQYAWLTDQPYSTIGFSHPQPGLAQELAATLGVGVFMQQSTEWSISLDRSRVNLGYVSGLMGDRGWEMFAVETRLQPNAIQPNQLQTNWYFKRQGTHEPAGSAASAGTAAATSSMSGGAPAMGTAPAMGAPMMPAAPQMSAAPAMQAPSYAQPTQPMQSPYAQPAMQTTPTYGVPESPAMPSAPSAPDAPAAPAGPDQAPMNPGTNPPPGPGQS